MSSVGTSNGKSNGKMWNRAVAYRTADGKIEFRLHYEDPETLKYRFTGRGDQKKVDEIVFAMDDIEALAVLSSLAADAISDIIHRQETLRRHLNREERSTT